MRETVVKKTLNNTKRCKLKQIDFLWIFYSNCTWFTWCTECGIRCCVNKRVRKRCARKNRDKTTAKARLCRRARGIDCAQERNGNATCAPRVSRLQELKLLCASVKGGRGCISNHACRSQRGAYYTFDVFFGNPRAGCTSHRLMGFSSVPQTPCDSEIIMIQIRNNVYTAVREPPCCCEPFAHRTDSCTRVRGKRWNPFEIGMYMAPERIIFLRGQHVPGTTVTPGLRRCAHKRLCGMPADTSAQYVMHEWSVRVWIINETRRRRGCARAGKSRINNAYQTNTATQT